MTEKNDLSGLPSFEHYRDPNAPSEKPDKPPKFYPSVWKWAIAGVVVGALLGIVPEVIAQLDRGADLVPALTATLRRIATLFWAGGGGIVGALIGAFIDEHSARGRKN